MTRQHLAILILTAGYVFGCAGQHESTPAPIITAPKAVAPVTPAAHQTTIYAGKVVTALDDVLARAQQVPEYTGRVGLITGLTNARAVAVEATSRAEATETLAKAKDEEAKESQAALVAANKAIQAEHADKEKLGGELNAANDKIKEMNHDLVRWIFAAGIALCITVSVIGGTFAFKGNLALGLPMIAGGLVGDGACIAGLTLEHFFYTYEKPIGIGVCIVALGAIVAGVYFGYQRLHLATVSAVKGIQANIAAGHIDLAEAGPVFKAVETPLLAKLVNSNTPKDATSHILPAMSKADVLNTNDAPMNLVAEAI